MNNADHDRAVEVAFELLRHMSYAVDQLIVEHREIDASDRRHLCDLYAVRAWLGERPFLRISGGDRLDERLVRDIASFLASDFSYVLNGSMGDRTLSVYGDHDIDVVKILERSRTIADVRNDTFICYLRRALSNAPCRVEAAELRRAVDGTPARLVARVIRLLPAWEQARYREELDSAMHDLVAAGTSRWAQLGYALRLSLRIWSLRRAHQTSPPAGERAR